MSGHTLGSWSWWLSCSPLGREVSQLTSRTEGERGGGKEGEKGGGREGGRERNHIIPHY